MDTEKDINVFKIDKRFRLYKYGFRYCLESEYYIGTTHHLRDVFNLDVVSEITKAAFIGGKINKYTERSLPKATYAYEIISANRNKSRFYLREEDYFLYKMTR